MAIRLGSEPLLQVTDLTKREVEAGEVALTRPHGGTGYVGYTVTPGRRRHSARGGRSSSLRGPVRASLPHGDHKFEWYEPGASLTAIAAELDDKATIFAPSGDREQLLRYVTVNVAVGNTDAHAKNYSLLHDERGGTRLAPLYDIAPVALGYNASDRLAMSINGKRHQGDITTEDLAAEAARWEIGEARAIEIVGDTLERLIEGTRTLPAHDSIEAHVPGYVRHQAQNLIEGKAARIDSYTPLMLLPRLGTPAGRVGEGGAFVSRDHPESGADLR